MSETISEDKALSVAQQFMNANRLRHRALVRWNGIRKNTNYEKSQSQDPYYIFTSSDSMGFVIVAGDDLARPILAYSKDARLGDRDNLPPGMQDWLNDIRRQISAAQNGLASPSEDVARQWAAPSEGNVLKQLNTALWDQGYPYHNQCPMDGNARTLTGCVPTAYAILMKYYNYPARGKGLTKQYETASKGFNVNTRDLNHEYDWDSMPMEYVNGKYSAKQASNVANLMADIGAALQVDYKTDVTVGFLGLAQLFVNFDYFPGWQQYKGANSVENWYGLLCAELNQDRPIIYRAENQKGDGHAFILDGYTDKDYFHVNWGWGGDCNGYFALDAMIPSEVDDYTSHQSAFLSCIPMPMYEQRNVAKVGERECPSLTIAVALAEESSSSPVTVSLLENTPCDRVEIASGQDISLELNGKKLDMSSSFAVKGKLTVTDNAHGGCINQPFSNNELFVNYGTLVIEGGTFTNEYKGAEGEYYRRCIWSDEGSQTIISGGTFRTYNNAPLCFRGDATILGGEFTCKGNSEVVSNYNTYGGTIDIQGGTFTNTLGSVSGSDYRRAIWTTQGSDTRISGGTFSSKGNTLCFNGDATISGGDFICQGNSAVISNYNTYGTLDIQGGTFKNSLTSVSGSDYRRAIWTTQGSETSISGGTFSSRGTQTLCFNGDATISHATIDNTNSSGCGCLAYSGSNVTIYSCWLKSKNLFYSSEESSLQCIGGYFSSVVQDGFLGEDCECIRNTENETKAKYPYMVADNSEDAILAKEEESVSSVPIYDLSGRKLPKVPQKGLYIMNGKKVRVN
ncbi:MAG: C10 family peptidase [Bacteroidaceae bacterium]|nr:C10 family peptidase [Bacteroidaceae bacterium]